MTKDTPERSSDHKHTVEDSVALDTVLDLEQGDVVALRAIRGDEGRVIAGCVTSTLNAEGDPKTVLERRLEETDSAIIHSVDVDCWWELSNGEFEDRSHVLEDRPPIQESLSGPTTDPPPCTLSYEEPDRVSFRVPGPVSNGSRVLYYATADYGTVVALEGGSVVSPEQLLPSGYEPP